MYSADMDHHDTERSWDEEEDNLKTKIEKFWVEHHDHDEEEAHGGFASHNLPQSFDQPPNQSIDDVEGGVHNFEESLLSPGRLNLQEVDSRSRPLLGLTLRKTPSFVRLLEMRLSTPSIVSAQDNQVSEHDRPRATSSTENFNMGSQPLSEKLKASNFPITTITIGAWKRVSRREGDLTAKLYYAKRKLVWEVLDGQLKSKMEVLWSDITAIKAVMLHNQPGILHIELDKPPLFFRETTPEPRKHTTWQQASDFTGGQAPRYRRHCAIFPPGVLDKHYEKLLQCDQQLLELSQKPFPSQDSPYFNTAMPFDIPGLSVNFNGLGPRFLPVMQHYPYPAYPTTSRAPPLNPTMTVNIPHRHERARNCQLVRQTVWDERLHFPMTNVYFEEPSPTLGNPHHNVVTLNEIEKHLLRETQIVHSDDEGSGLPAAAQVQPMDSLFNPNPNMININANHSGICYQITDASSVDQVMMQNNATDNMAMNMTIQPINWLQPPLMQGSTDSSTSVVDNGGLCSTLYPNQVLLKKY